MPRATYLVGRLDRLLRRRLGDALAPHGLTLAEYTALSVLQSRPGLSNAQLARRTLITPQSMNEVLAHLVGLGLVSRTPDPEHARVLRTQLTAAGKRTLAVANRTVAATEREMLSGLSDAQAAKFAAALASCIEQLEA
ncbi:MAG: MarR family winged helix-turn-helix transcriptional regulator [Sciscionella sp.]